MIEIGTPVPEWHLEALGKQPPPALADLRGKEILLLFYNNGCQGCKSRALPISKNIHQLYPEMYLIGVHTEPGRPRYSDQEILEEWEALAMPYPLFKDQGRQTYERYRAEGTPHWIWINSEGLLLRSIFGSQPNAIQRLDLLLLERFGNPGE